jgi:hypothetical protein
LETDRAATKLFDDVHALMREAADEIERLRAEVAKANAERDEARREVCLAYGPMVEALAAAKRRGWDCFDAKEGSGA